MGRRRITPAAAGAVPWGDVFVPCTSASDLTGYGEHPGGLIDAVDEFARIELRIPNDFVAVIDLEIIYIVAAVSPTFHATINTDYGTVGESAATHQEGEANREIDGGSLGWLQSHSIADLVDAGPIEAGEHLGIEVTYSATVPATNIMVLGARLTYR